MAKTSTSTEPLRREIERAGYHPQLVEEAVREALGGEDVRAFCVHQETTFDRDEVRRHVTVLALTPTRLVAAHADDHPADDLTATAYVSTSTETVALAAVRSVVVNRVVTEPARPKGSTRARPSGSGALPAEVTLTIGWGGVARIELEPAECPDPNCEADHGYTGTSTADDIALRVSAAAEGPDAVERITAFAAALTRATAAAGAGGRPDHASG
jgi:hypothetical protein